MIMTTCHQTDATRIEFFKKIPLYALPSAWNDAGDIRFQHNRITFKIALKDKLLEDINND
jgi:hypothetical protein